jgi:hypothetical protein
VKAKFWRTREFERLAQEWERHLSESGFRDAEMTVKGDRILREPANNAVRRRSQVVREAGAEYFALLAEKFAQETDFADESDRLIMEATVNGWTIKEISQYLSQYGLKKANRDTIRYIRRRYEMRWRIRHWEPWQMISRKVPIRS